MSASIEQGTIEVESPTHSPHEFVKTMVERAVAGGDSRLVISLLGMTR